MITLHVLHVLPVLLVMMLSPRGALAFNLEPRHAVCIKDPDINSSFGYTLSFWREKAWEKESYKLIVGAPEGKVDVPEREPRRMGVVYGCPIYTNVKKVVPKCEAFHILKKDVINEQALILTEVEKKTPRSGMRLGATIAVENRTNGAIAVCAPRMMEWDQQNFNSSGSIPGTCFFLRHNTSNTINDFTDLENLYPDISTSWTKLAQDGMSAQFVENTENPQLVTGATGFNAFKGSVSVYSPIESSTDNLPLPKVLQASNITNDTYLGYSVTTARFHKDGRVSYVSGAPRAEGEDLYTGAVFVLSFNNTVECLNGTQMGEYFGASVAAVDLEGDGRHDLLVVGAPLHSYREGKDDEAGGDHGKVYVYVNKGEARLEKVNVSLTGSSVSGGRFGSSIAVVGDLNKDGFTDIAVGAPYESQGAVYIYLGQKGGLRSKFSQRISPEDIQGYPEPYTAGFGFSIASGVDVDDNSFNDLAIGHHEAGLVWLVMSYPVVEVVAYLNSSLQSLDMDDGFTGFDVTACLWYISRPGTKRLKNIKATISLTVEPTLQRAVFVTDLKDSGTVEVEELLQESKKCRTFRVKLKDQLSVITRPLEISMNYSLLHPGTPPTGSRVKRSSSKFCKDCGVMDPQEQTVVLKELPFSCQNSDCTTDLRVEVKISNNGGLVVVGRDTRLLVDVLVWQTGEPAYQARLSVTLSPEEVGLELPSNCLQEDADNNTQIAVCSLGHKLVTGPTNEPVKIHFEVDLSGLVKEPPQLQTKMLVFTFSAISASEERTPGDNSVYLEIPVQRVDKLVINGYTHEGFVFLASKEAMNKSDIIVNHVYEVANAGYLPVNPVSNFLVMVPLAKDGSNLALFARPPEVSVTYKNYSPLRPTRPCTVDSVGPETAQPEDTTRGHGKHTTRKPDNGNQEGTIWYRRRRAVTESSLNSSNDESVHVRVHCETEALPPNRTVRFVLKLEINKSQLVYLAKDVTSVIIATNLSVTVPDVMANRSLDARVETMAREEKEPEQDLCLRWGSLGFFLGLFLLILMANEMDKKGFFKRQHKDKLQALRRQTKLAEYENLLLNSAS